MKKCFVTSGPGNRLHRIEQGGKAASMKEPIIEYEAKSACHDE